VAGSPAHIDYLILIKTGFQHSQGGAYPPGRCCASWGDPPGFSGFNHSAAPASWKVSWTAYFWRVAVLLVHRTL